jgi:hypothetical protein
MEERCFIEKSLESIINTKSENERKRTEKVRKNLIKLCLYSLYGQK